MSDVGSDEEDQGPNLGVSLPRYLPTHEMMCHKRNKICVYDGAFYLATNFFYFCK